MKTLIVLASPQRKLGVIPIVRNRANASALRLAGTLEHTPEQAQQ
jgi:hypothetical protein